MTLTRLVPRHLTHWLVNAGESVILVVCPCHYLRLSVGIRRPAKTMVPRHPHCP